MTGLRLAQGDMVATIIQVSACAKTMKETLGPADYLKKILTARVYDVASESALEPAQRLRAGGCTTRCCSSVEEPAGGAQFQAARGLQQDGAAEHRRS